ncbi:hypothetical protein GE061_006676 [Apolygus lucorum]|uniref:Uncharacterized protein n=1 Tax=Apolygus lucorum TaxID=248454 RepID=A0A8S9WUJ4_APOLU|nr:hypothetical protein GE061_006676 [Apolygus lucorum]
MVGKKNGKKHDSDFDESTRRLSKRFTTRATIHTRREDDEEEVVEIGPDPELRRPHQRGENDEDEELAPTLALCCDHLRVGLIFNKMELVNESSKEDLDWFIVDEEDIVVAAREFLVEKVDPGNRSNCCTLYTDILNDIMDTLDEPNISVNSPCRSIMSELDVPPDVVPTLEVNENEHHAEERLNDDSPSVHQDQFSFPENNNFGYAEGAGRHDAEDLNSGQRDPDFDPNTDCNSDSSGLIAVPEKNSVEGDVIEVRMRKSKGQGVKRKREQAKTHREKGEAYLGYHRKRSTGNGFVHRMIQENPKNPKVMGPPSDSVKCKKWATRSCETVSETDRHKLFTSFWKDMSWDSKKMFICSLADIKQTNISTVKDRVEKPRLPEDILPWHTI